MFPVTTTSAASFAASRRICGMSTRPCPSIARVLAEVVDALEEFVLRAVDRRQLGELLFELPPDRQRERRKFLPWIDVTKRSRPNASSICCRKRFGTFSRPFSSRRAGALPESDPFLQLGSRRKSGTTFSHFWPDSATARMLEVPSFISQGKLFALKNRSVKRAKERVRPAKVPLEALHCKVESST